MTETFAGRVAALLLALIWLTSMGMTDINAYSFLPTLVGLGVVILLALSSLIRGARAVRLSKTAWTSLAVGAYFLVRCLCTTVDVEGTWREASLILACGVFYVAGVYAAQGRSLRPAVGVLLAGVLLNIAYFYLMQHTDVPMEWTGRPAIGPGGENHRPVTLFVYKNQAGAFLVLSGMLLLAAALWASRLKLVPKIFIVAVGVGAVALSDSCGTRAVLLLAPFMLVMAWVLWVALKLHASEQLSMGVILSGFAILGCVGFGVCALFFDADLASWVMSIDTHDRYRIWGECCRFLHEAPIWGYGAGSVRWMLLPRVCGTSSLVNYAHNEYLQAWFDYGLIGVAGVLYVVFGHIVRGGVILLSEHTCRMQKTMVALALLCFAGWGGASFVDFFWHHVSLAAMTAFAAGVLASPYPYVHRGRQCRVTAQGGRGKGVLSMMGCGCIALCAWLVSVFLPVWNQQWAFNRLSSPGADDDGAQRLKMLNGLLPRYPSHRLLDTAYPLSGTAPWPEEESMLLRVLEANPRQLYMIAARGRMLTLQGRYAEAESLYRRCFPGDGLPRMGNTIWPKFYFFNLILWGQECMIQGDMPGAYSRIAYALNILTNSKLNFFIVGRHLHDVWRMTPEEQKEFRTYLEARKQDVKLMKALGIEPDDSWIQPVEPGGKPALYRRYGLADESEREAVAEEERRAGRLRGEKP